MMRTPPFVGHRRYSITHRAVQRLRELVPGHDGDDDDESLRDKLDSALGDAEDGGKAIRTLDAMLGEPQTLIPIDAFGDLLYAIIKEETVVTVLPRGHGEEILHRGQAMEQRVASGQAAVRAPLEPREREDDRRDQPRRRWRKDTVPPVVVERVVRPGTNGTNGHSEEIDRSVQQELPELEDEPVTAEDAPVRDEEPRRRVVPSRGRVQLTPVPRYADLEPVGPVETVLHDALELGRRRAAIAALREVLSQHDSQDALLPLWNAVAHEGLPERMTIGDLIEAVQGL